VEANNSGGKGSQRAIAPSDDDDDDFPSQLLSVLIPSISQ
jgi:hypothetical protein